MALQKSTTLFFHSQFPHLGNMPGARRPGNRSIEVSPQVVLDTCPPTTGSLRNECPGTEERA